MKDYMIPILAQITALVGLLVTLGIARVQAKTTRDLKLLELKAEIHMKSKQEWISEFRKKVSHFLFITDPNTLPGGVP